MLHHTIGATFLICGRVRTLATTHVLNVPIGARCKQPDHVLGGTAAPPYWRLLACASAGFPGPVTCAAFLMHHRRAGWHEDIPAPGRAPKVPPVTRGGCLPGCINTDASVLLPCLTCTDVPRQSRAGEMLPGWTPSSGREHRATALGIVGHCSGSRNWVTLVMPGAAPWAGHRGIRNSSRQPGALYPGTAPNSKIRAPPSASPPRRATPSRAAPRPIYSKSNSLPPPQQPPHTASRPAPRGCQKQLIGFRNSPRRPDRHSIGCRRPAGVGAGGRLGGRRLAAPGRAARARRGGSPPRAGVDPGRVPGECCPPLAMATTATARGGGRTRRRERCCRRARTLRPARLREHTCPKLTGP